MQEPGLLLPAVQVLKRDSSNLLLCRQQIAGHGKPDVAHQC